MSSESVDARPDLRDPARLAGVVAAATALAVTELVRAVTADAPSLIVAVGDVFVDGLPGDVTRTVIGAIGTADKPALLIGIVVVSLLIGARTGTAALSRRWVGDVVFVAFGLLGALTGMRAPLTTDGGAIAAATLGAATGALSLRLLLRTAAAWTAPDHAGGADAGRRQFLALAGATGVFAAAVGLMGRSLGLGRTVEAARADVVLPEVTGGTRPTAADAGLDVEGITPQVTPNADFYRIDTALTVPQVDPAGWTLTIDGMVDEPLELTFAELLALPLVEREVTIACVSNEVGGDLVGNARWLGVPLRSLLREAGVQDGATQVMGHSVDGFTAGFPTELLDDDRPALVAVGMNGEPLPLEHGFPARLIIGGIYGYVSATKWLQRIELTTLDAADGYWIPRGWAKEAPIKTQTRIDTPRSSDQHAGSVPVAGVAWAPTRGIAKVEVQVDDGPWEEARLGPGTSDDTWRQWVYDWRPEPGRYRLRARATDGDGETQTEDTAPPAPDGATGYPTRTVTVT
ncbi:MAG: sulfite oxidase [Acidimicrobiales bacterium]|nr:sulfite oxidase [Acidimicrobiales bacterium]